MQEQLYYLKSVIEGAPNIEPWSAWISNNAASLEKLLTRTEFLNLKLHRIKAIPPILDRFRISYEESERYQYLGGIPGRCKECGASLDYSPGFETKGGFVRCRNGCFAMHALTRPNQSR